MIGLRAIRDDDPEELRLALYHVLTPREEAVLLRIYGIGEPPRTLTEIGRQFGVHRSRIAHVRDRALAKLAGWR